MNFQLVPVAASGPCTFLCCKCGERISQPAQRVWADLDGPSFVFWCTPCKRAEVIRRVA